MKINNNVTKFNNYTGINTRDLYKLTASNSEKTAVEKYNNIAFGMRVNYGTPASLSDILQKKIQNIHSNLDFITEFFNDKINKPKICADIRKGYADLVSKRSSGLVFKLPDSENTIEIMRSQTRKNILYISINDNSNEFNGIVADGKDKLIANILKLHPHMLPKYLKYMNSERLKETKPDNYITPADNKLQEYTDYLRNWQAPTLKNKKDTQKKERNNIKSKTEKKTPIRKTSEKHHYSAKKINTENEKVTIVSNEDFEKHINNKIKNILTNISALLTNKNKFPEYITPKLAPNGNILGFKLNTDDGGILTVTKKVVGCYGNSMPYLSFEKINADKSLNFISIDLITDKVLRTKEKGKPHISSSHIVHELSTEEIKKRKIVEKLDYYMSQIFRDAAEKDTIPKENNSVNKQHFQENNQNKIKAETPQNTQLSETNQVFDIEKTFLNMRQLGIKDGSKAAAEYFDAFQKQFIKELQKKMTDFNEKFKIFMDTIGNI